MKWLGRLALVLVAALVGAGLYAYLLATPRSLRPDPPALVEQIRSDASSAPVPASPWKSDT